MQRHLKILNDRRLVTGFQTLESWVIVQQFGIFRNIKKIKLGISKIHVIKIENTKPVKYQLVKLMIAWAKK